jgi:hypothetical protein
MTLEFRLQNQSRALKNKLNLNKCVSFWCKLRGLAWRNSLPDHRGLVFILPTESRASASVHMFGMFFHLAIIWLDTDLKVVDIQKAYAWRSILFPKIKAKYVIECRISRISEFKIGDQLALEPK